MWRRTVIDLTALLDVILILLFLVLNNASYSANQLQETARAEAARLARLETAYEGLERENQRLGREVDSFTWLRERARVVTLYVQRAGERRTVYVETPKESLPYPLTWDNGPVVEQALYAKLTRLCGAGPEQITFLALRYDRNTLYQSDYALLSRVILRVKQACGDVYSAEYDLKEEEHGTGPQ